jgi:hypothetical protein
MKDILALNNIYVDFFKLRDDYFNKWQELCSPLTKKTLKPQILCNKLYYLKIEKENVLYSDLVNLKEEIKGDIIIPIEVIENYASNYGSLCVNLGYSNALPGDDTVYQNDTIINQTIDNDYKDLIIAGGIIFAVVIGIILLSWLLSPAKKTNELEI